MQSGEYAAMFPSPKLRLPAVASTEEWSTSARRSLQDGQPSFKALGLATGFVGQGVDTLIIDDPYASPQDAYSPIVNASTHGFWSDTAKPRLNDDTNVVVMFHRYTETDLAGWLMETEPDEWELIRYAAIADGDYIHPETGRVYPDPIGRAEGEKFSARFSDDWYETQQKNTFVWLSQFQGRPSAREGGMFKLHQLPIVPAAPVEAQRVRYWDLGGSDSKKADYSVGCLMSKTPEGLFYIEDVKRGQWSPKERNEHVRTTAENDKQKYPDVKTWIEKVPGLAVEVIDNIVRYLAGFSVHTEMAKNDKVTRADPLASQCEANNVKVVSGPWNAAFRSELMAFPNGKNDDQVDAASGAFSKLAGQRKIRML
jgi:predicted phage terminase large subunit-like protein